jgi:hypothetical protein
MHMSHNRKIISMNVAHLRSRISMVATSRRRRTPSRRRKSTPLLDATRRHAHLHHHAHRHTHASTVKQCTPPRVRAANAVHSTSVRRHYSPGRRSHSYSRAHSSARSPSMLRLVQTILRAYSVSAARMRAESHFACTHVRVDGAAPSAAVRSRVDDSRDAHRRMHTLCVCLNRTSTASWRS